MRGKVLPGPGGTAPDDLGLVGSGFLAVPILTTSAAYAVCETFQWKHGLDLKLGQARSFYVVTGVATLAMGIPL